MRSSKKSFDSSKNKYALYEQSVQSPDTDANWVLNVFRELNGRYPARVREDFCGTFAFSCAWVGRNRNNEAIAIDLDPEPLRYGRENHLSRLSAAQRKRLEVIQGDVTRVRTRPADLVVAGNFSFFVFKTRPDLLKYLRNVRRGLKKGGIVVLEMAGGPGMIKPMRERKTVRERGRKLFTYIWHQKKFDPITHNAEYAIHFKFPSGREMKDAFTYDWRLWTIPEVREGLLDAGFDEVQVFWETTHRGEGTGEYVPAASGDNAFAWIAYVVGIRRR